MDCLLWMRTLKQRVWYVSILRILLGVVLCPKLHIFNAFLGQSRSQALAHEVMTPDQDLRSRDRELTEIAKSIAQLAELFKDLSAMVIDQGTLLDSVEYNIEQTAVQMSDAVKELDMATQCVFFHFISLISLVLSPIYIGIRRTLEDENVSSSSS